MWVPHVKEGNKEEKFKNKVDYWEVKVKNKENCENEENFKNEELAKDEAIGTVPSDIFSLEKWQ